MSTTARTREFATVSAARGLALAGGLALTGSYVATLYGVTTVVGDPGLLLGVVAAALVLATAMAAIVRPRTAGLLAAGMFVVGVAAYVSAVPLGWHLLLDLSTVLVDVMALLSGVSLLRMTEAGTWAVGFAPAPVFLSWYLLVRRKYALGVAVGGATLLAFVLTTDAGQTAALAGTVGATAALGFGEIDLRRGTDAELEAVTALLAVMVVASATVSLVPAGEADPFVPEQQSPTIEGGYLTADDRVEVVGSIDLSPQVRFVVESEEPAYWRVNGFDRYTGDGWVRSGGTRTAQGGLPGPPGPSERITQTFTAKSSVGVIPAAWRPVSVDSTVQDRARVTSLGGFQPTGPIREGESYTVVSERPQASTEDLRSAGTDYPEDLHERYTQLPDSTSDRLAEFTDELTAGAGSPYETAVLIQRWLSENKGYSLDVTRPSGDVADSFVFEMEAGYCVYFATAMATMLRTQGVPARFVTGYGTGQQVDDDTWVVRELNSHAWVEVYFPGIGWVTFDPTPSSPRGDVRSDSLADARERGDSGVDAAGSEAGAWSPTPGPGDPAETVAPPDGGDDDGTPTPEVAAAPGNIDMSEFEDDGGGEGDGLPRTLIGFGLLVVVGLAAGVRRTDAVGRAQWAATVLWQRASEDPATDVERAYDRMEYVIGRQYRPRRTGETRRQYLRTIYSLERDDRIRRVGDLALRARYDGDLSREEADEAVALVDELVRDHAPLLSRLRN